MYFVFLHILYYLIVNLRRKFLKFYKFPSSSPRDFLTISHSRLLFWYNRLLQIILKPLANKPMIFPMMTFVEHFASRLSTKTTLSKLFSTLKSLNKVRKNIQGVLYRVFFLESSVIFVVSSEGNVFYLLFITNTRQFYSSREKG